MFSYEEYNLNENLEPILGDYVLVKSPRGNYYRHKNYKLDLNSDFTIKSNGFIDSNGDVYLDYDAYDEYPIDFSAIPFLFNKIEGNFSISNNSIYSLLGSPKKVSGFFDCSNNLKLKTFKGCPQLVGGDFNCCNCKSLISIDYFNTIVKGEIKADDTIKKGLEIIQFLYKQHSLLSQIEDYTLFVHTVIGYAPELKQYYKQIPKLNNSHEDLTTFL